jgi:hypothetical protein
MPSKKNRNIKQEFCKISEILPENLELNWESFSLDPIAPFLWAVLHAIISYVPDGVEFPKISPDFNPQYEDPQKLEYNRINNCWRFRLWWVSIERWKMYSLDDLPAELKREMLIQEPEAKRTIAELNLWEGIYSCSGKPKDLPHPIGADAWQHMQLNDKTHTFFNKTNIECEKRQLREIKKYLSYSESSNINPYDINEFPYHHKMLALSHFVLTQDSERREEFITKHLNPYLNAVSNCLSILRHGILLPGEKERAYYRHNIIKGGKEYLIVGGKRVEIFSRKFPKNYLSGRGRKPKKLI